MKDYLLKIWEINNNRTFKLIKAVLFVLTALITLLFILDSNWINTHITLNNNAPKLLPINLMATFISGMFNLDLVKDCTKITLISILILVLILIVILAFFRSIFFFIGMSFLGTQCFSVYSNYIAENDVLYKIPFTNKSILNRIWTIEEKRAFVENTVNGFMNSHKCPKDMVDIELIINETQFLESKQAIVTATKEALNSAYTNYINVKNSWNSGDLGYWILTSITNHPYITVGVILTLTATGILYYIYWAGLAKSLVAVGTASAVAVDSNLKVTAVEGSVTDAIIKCNVINENALDNLRKIVDQNRQQDIESFFTVRETINIITENIGIHKSLIASLDLTIKEQIAKINDHQEALDLFIELVGPQHAEIIKSIRENLKQK